MSELDEFGRIELLRRIFESAGAAPRAPGVLLGIGDDAAVLAPSSDPLVVSVDACVERVHFRRELLSLRDLGYRATTAALSDLAAMGASPIAIVAALVLPPWVDDAALAELATGQRDAADEVSSAIVGGNLARGSELSLTTTVIGHCPRPMRRDGARAGDGVWMAGRVGLAAAGLAILTATEGSRDDERAAAAIDAWRRPRARIDDGLRARDLATAGIDVSDGLARDVGHIARASGARIVLEADALVTADLDELGGRLGHDPLEWILHGGDDYALVVTLPAEARVDGFSRIGTVEAARSEAGEVACVRADGSVVAVDEHGFDHFRAPR